MPRKSDAMETAPASPLRRSTRIANTSATRADSPLPTISTAPRTRRASSVCSEPPSVPAKITRNKRLSLTQEPTDADRTGRTTSLRKYTLRRSMSKSPETLKLEMESAGNVEPVHTKLRTLRGRSKSPAADEKPVVVKPVSKRRASVTEKLKPMDMIDENKETETVAKIKETLTRVIVEEEEDDVVVVTEQKITPDVVRITPESSPDGQSFNKENINANATKSKRFSISQPVTGQTACPIKPLSPVVSIKRLTSANISSSRVVSVTRALKNNEDMMTFSPEDDVAGKQSDAKPDKKMSDDLTTSIFKGHESSESELDDTTLAIYNAMLDATAGEDENNTNAERSDGASTLDDPSDSAKLMHPKLKYKLERQNNSTDNKSATIVDDFDEPMDVDVVENSPCKDAGNDTFVIDGPDKEGTSSRRSSERIKQCVDGDLLKSQTNGKVDVVDITKEDDVTEICSSPFKLKPSPRKSTSKVSTNLDVLEKSVDIVRTDEKLSESPVILRRSPRKSSSFENGKENSINLDDNVEDNVIIVDEVEDPSKMLRGATTTRKSFGSVHRNEEKTIVEVVCDREMMNNENVEEFNFLSKRKSITREEGVNKSGSSPELIKANSSEKSGRFSASKESVRNKTEGKEENTVSSSTKNDRTIIDVQLLEESRNDNKCEEETVLEKRTEADVSKQDSGVSKRKSNGKSKNSRQEETSDFGDMNLQLVESDVDTETTKKAELTPKSNEKIEQLLKNYRVQNKQRLKSCSPSFDSPVESEPKDVSSENSDTSDVMVNSFIDEMAEEGSDEDDPSVDSNEIVDEGESVGSSSSYEERSDNTYENDSFIADDDFNEELLEGNEYDLGYEKVSKEKRKSRIIQIEDSSEEEPDDAPALPDVTDPDDVEVVDLEEDDDESDGQDTGPTIVEIVEDVNPTDLNEPLNTSISVISSPATDSKRKSVTVSVHDALDIATITKRDLFTDAMLSPVVEMLCSSVEKSGAVGMCNLSINVSVEYTDEKKDAKKRKSSTGRTSKVNITDVSDPNTTEEIESSIEKQSPNGNTGQKHGSSKKKNKLFREMSEKLPSNKTKNNSPSISSTSFDNSTPKDITNKKSQKKLNVSLGENTSATLLGGLDIKRDSPKKRKRSRKSLPAELFNSVSDENEHQIINTSLVSLLKNENDTSETNDNDIIQDANDNNEISIKKKRNKKKKKNAGQSSENDNESNRMEYLSYVSIRDLVKNETKAKKSAKLEMKNNKEFLPSTTIHSDKWACEPVVMVLPQPTLQQPPERNRKRKTVDTNVTKKSKVMKFNALNKKLKVSSCGQTIPNIKNEILNSNVKRMQTKDLMNKKKKSQFTFNV